MSGNGLRNRAFRFPFVWFVAGDPVFGVFLLLLGEALFAFFSFFDSVGHGVLFSL